MDRNGRPETQVCILCTLTSEKLEISCLRAILLNLCDLVVVVVVLLLLLMVVVMVVVVVVKLPSFLHV